MKLLQDQRLIFVTGKGGAGKSTLATALAELSATRGAGPRRRRTLLVEIDVSRSALAALTGVTPGYRPVAVNEHLDVCNITWKPALDDWLEQTVPVQRVVRLVTRNRIVQLFLDATPGLREIVILSRLLGYLQDYDRVIVDLPASGHAISMLRVPRIAVSLMRAGPVRERGQALLDVFRSSSTSLVLVALPEEMVVNETIELRERLRDRVPELRTALVVLNQASPPSLTAAEATLLQRMSQAAPADEAARELLRAGRWEASLEVATAQALDRIATELELPVVSFPRLGPRGGRDGGPRGIVEQMTRALARAEVSAS